MDYSKIGKKNIFMEGYLRKVLYKFPEEINVRVEMPAATYLFEVRSGKEQVMLEELRVQEFHHFISQLLFTFMICKKDIQTAVAFLMTWVRSPDEDDWKKLRHLPKYVKCTIRLLLILSADNLNVLKWWVDASYAAHDHMRRHNGATLSMVRGLVLSISKIKNDHKYLH